MRAEIPLGASDKLVEDTRLLERHRQLLYCAHQLEYAFLKQDVDELPLSSGILKEFRKRHYNGPAHSLTSRTGSRQAGLAFSVQWFSWR